MVQVTIEDAQSRLGELIASGIPGEEIGIIQGSRLVAKLVPLVSDDAPGPRLRRPGTAAGSILYMAEDFDAPLGGLPRVHGMTG
jgi:antitoxin (DNA-binding transcriptional repressor) of toxin-antitoxin stability system